MGYPSAALHRRMGYIGLFSVAAAVLLLPGTARAAITLDFYTPGGYDMIVYGFNTASLLITDPAIRQAAWIAGFVGLAIAFAQVGFSSKGGFMPLKKWFIGLSIFVYTMSSTGSVFVYDTVLNRTSGAIPVPSIMVAMAGGMNVIQRSLVRVVETAGAIIIPMGVSGLNYRSSAGPVGLKALLEAAKANDLEDAYLQNSLFKYLDDCWAMEILNQSNNGGVNIDLNAVKSGSGSLLDQLAIGNNPAFYTVYYAQGDNVGVTMKCSDAWTALSGYLANDANFTTAVKSACGGAGFNPASNAEVSQGGGKCNLQISSWVNAVNNTSGVTSEGFARQAYLARAIEAKRMEWDPSYAANANYMSQTSGVAEFFEEWMPIMQAGVLTMTLIFTPILFIFLPTQMFDKILLGLLGLYLFNVVWAVTDAVVHTAMVAHSMKALEIIRQKHIGMDAILLMPNSIMRTLAQWYQWRMAAMSFAGVLTGLFVKFGHASVAFSGAVSGSGAAVGGSSGQEVYTPSGQAQSLDRFANMEIPNLRNGAAYGAEAMAESSTRSKAASIGSGLGYSGQQDAFNVGKTGTEINAGRTMAAGDVFKENFGDVRQGSHATNETTTRDAVGKAKGIREASAQLGKPVEQVSAENEATSRYGTQAQREKWTALADTLGVSQNSVMASAAKGLVMTQQMVDNAERHGLHGLSVGMRVDPNSVAQGENGKIAHMDAAQDMGKDQLLTQAEKLEGAGHHNAAQGMREIAGGLRDGESAAVKIGMGPGGNISTMDVQHGARSSHYDASGKQFTRSSEKGEKSWQGQSHVTEHTKKNVHDELNTDQSGSRVLKENTNTERADGIGGSSEKHFINVPHQGKVLVSGHNNKTYDDKRVTGEGVTSTTYDPITGKAALEESKMGKSQKIDKDTTVVDGGTHVQADTITNAAEAVGGKDFALGVGTGVKAVKDVFGIVKPVDYFSGSKAGQKSQPPHIPEAMSNEEAVKKAMKQAGL